MHRVVIFSEPVISNGIELYGRLYSGESEGQIINAARFDYKTLLIRELWEGEVGETFRKNEGWTLTHSKDGSTAWYLYDESKYTFCLGYNPIPDQFVESLSNPFARHIALISGWVPLKMADCNDEDYIINGAFYDMVANATDIQWTDVEEPEGDDLPF